MIYTLTLNPAIDLFIETTQMKPNTVNRTNNSDVQANGKGINVSFILKRLGIDNTALGIGGGFTNQYIRDTLTQNQIPNQFITIDGLTRINVFTRVLDQQQEYKLVNKGPYVNQKAQTNLLKLLDKLQSGDWLCISGSFAQGIEPDILILIAQKMQQKKVRLVLDTSYAAVLKTLRYQPYLIKPNEAELARWLKLPAKPTRTQLIHAAQELIQQGAQNVLLSLGAQGACLITTERVYYGNAPEINVLNTAGSGDTMLGTFIAGKIQHLTEQANLRRSIAAGSDTAQQSWITDFTHVNALTLQIHINEIKE